MLRFWLAVSCARPPQRPAMSDPPYAVHAVIQAGGRGERLRPRTDRTPKCLLSVGGSPMLERHIRKLESAGIASATIICGWLGNQVEAHVDRVASHYPGIELDVFHETGRLGNIGGLGLLRPRDCDLLFLFGDLVTDIEFNALLAAHRSGGGDITLASHLDPYRLSFGEIRVEGSLVREYIEKPVKHTLICSGVAVLRPAAVRLIRPGGALGISELVSAAIQAGQRVEHWQHQARWIDVNSEAALGAANRAVSGTP